MLYSLLAQLLYLVIVCHILVVLQLLMNVCTAVQEIYTAEYQAILASHRSYIPPIVDWLKSAKKLDLDSQFRIIFKGKEKFWTKSQ